MTAMAGADPSRARRAEILRGLGAGGAVLEEVLDYAANPYREISLPPGFPPLAEEPQVRFWRRYAAEAGEIGVAATLSRRFPQLRFPVRAGMAQEEPYRAATRRGAFDAERPQVGLALERPEALELAVEELAAGPVPVLVAPCRADFETLVRALTSRNEPVEVPASMGACLIKGLADWERVAAHRRSWREARGGADDESDWQVEMAALGQRKELWQDRLILVSTGPYSAVPAAEAGCPEVEWGERSVSIRLAHEGFHYLTLRLAGRIRSNLLDELVADFAGLGATYGAYSERLARRFLGVDRLPELRAGGRIEVYRGDPPLSDAALAVVARLAERATRNLARVELGPAEARAPAALSGLLVALARLELETFAAEDFLPALARERERLDAGAPEPS